MGFLDIPFGPLNDILSQYVSARSLVVLDSAFCNRDGRRYILDIERSLSSAQDFMSRLDCRLGMNPFMYYSMVQWLLMRRYPITNFQYTADQQICEHSFLNWLDVDGMNDGVMEVLDVSNVTELYLSGCSVSMIYFVLSVFSHNILMKIIFNNEPMAMVTPKDILWKHIPSNMFSSLQYVCLLGCSSTPSLPGSASYHLTALEALIGGLSAASQFVLNIDLDPENDPKLLYDLSLELHERTRQYQWRKISAKVVTARDGFQYGHIALYFDSSYEPPNVQRPNNAGVGQIVAPPLLLTNAAPPIGQLNVPTAANATVPPAAQQQEAEAAALPPV